MGYESSTISKLSKVRTHIATDHACSEPASELNFGRLQFDGQRNATKVKLWESPGTAGGLRHVVKMAKGRKAA
jgi:hypothetical protein